VLSFKTRLTLAPRSISKDNKRSYPNITLRFDACAVCSFVKLQHYPKRWVSEKRCGEKSGGDRDLHCQRRCYLLLLMFEKAEETKRKLSACLAGSVGPSSISAAPQEFLSRFFTTSDRLGTTNCQDQDTRMLGPTAPVFKSLHLYLASTQNSLVLRAWTSSRVRKNPPQTWTCAHPFENFCSLATPSQNDRPK
jgi:hypothetical protein